MSNGIFTVPTPANEPVLGYAPNSAERKTLKAELERQTKAFVEIPIIIGGKDITTSKKMKIVMPHRHSHTLAECSYAGEKELTLAVKTALEAKKTWSAMPFAHRASIFLKAAELLSTKYRAVLNAATMLGQSKTIMQAEIDAACELADFLRFNVYFAQKAYSDQPNSTIGVWNRMEYRPLDGFIAAISPFNFTSIAGNLSTAPAIMGNTIVWKPSHSSILSNYYLMRLFAEAGLPDGVINFVPCRGADMSKYVLMHPDFAGLHFTGSNEVFNEIWKTVGNNISSYKCYPRLVGETGGKDFIFAHNSADIEALVTALVRGAFEYQGQKCSAASRAYIPKSIWATVKKRLLAEIGKLKIGDPTDVTTFMGAVIEQKAFENTCKYIDDAKKSPDAEVICGGYDGSKGYFVFPTVIVAKKSDYISMRDEIFAPVLTIYVYEDAKLAETLQKCDTGSHYALTGAIFAQNRDIIVQMETALCGSAGNFYINDKPTGAVVGQQPFGGSRASGTNDKAGSMLNILRWTSPRTIKETFVPATTVAYPYMKE